ncbi:NIL domain-containing protein [Candidatus Formimonas warabiya]|uniref:(Fe-S)-binding protein n=1 Tax=Formimonas warabiya TaxID=1761012 RepID=A0A3G1KNB2_FORW1|nr:NIL domain-containing protein [Candidatus Formimonas warabiya]ATW23947.1 (Fe-S)-binding protein [Candidatus Formimonas warabiya]
MTVCKKVVLRFGAEIVDKPIIYSLIKEYGLIPNILKAEINPHKEGYLVMEVTGENEQYADGVEFLHSMGISVDALDQEVVWLKEKCTQCGLCTGLCPTQALIMNRPSMTVTFDGDKCIVCEMCLKSCPAKAVALNF